MIEVQRACLGAFNNKTVNKLGSVGLCDERRHGKAAEKDGVKRAGGEGGGRVGVVVCEGRRAESLLSLGNMGQPGCCHGVGSRSGTRVLPHLRSRPRCRAFCARRPHAQAGDGSFPRRAAPEAAGAGSSPRLPGEAPPAGR